MLQILPLVLVAQTVDYQPIDITAMTTLTFEKQVLEQPDEESLTVSTDTWGKKRHMALESSGWLCKGC